MEYLIIQTSGKQKIINFDKWCDIDFVRNAEINSYLAFQRILLYRQNQRVQIGFPILKNGFFVAKVIGQVSSKKCLVLKTKPKKNYTRRKGHKQKYTRIQFSI